MGAAEFIASRFVDKEIYISCGDVAETITYDQAWAANKEFFFGTVLGVEEGIVILEVPENGILYINGENIVSFWEPGVDYHQVVRTSLTRRVVGARRKDGFT